MTNKYEILELSVCTFKLRPNGIIPNLKDYPKRRLCVIDNNRKKAIDVDHELEYNYIETVNNLYFVNESSNKIKENERAAIFPVIVLDYNQDQKEKALDIISKLEEGYEFVDGNLALGNEEYLETLKEELKPENEKAKRFFKRKK